VNTFYLFLVLAAFALVAFVAGVVWLVRNRKADLDAAEERIVKVSRDNPFGK
jgi:hypothetical protein